MPRCDDGVKEGPHGRGEVVAALGDVAGPGSSDKEAVDYVGRLVGTWGCPAQLGPLEEGSFLVRGEGRGDGLSTVSGAGDRGAEASDERGDELVARVRKEGIECSRHAAVAA
jgi:hypothetical protein